MIKTLKTCNYTIPYQKWANHYFNTRHNCTTWAHWGVRWQLNNNQKQLNFISLGHCKTQNLPIYIKYKNSSNIQLTWGASRSCGTDLGAKINSWSPSSLHHSSLVGENSTLTSFHLSTFAQQSLGSQHHTKFIVHHNLCCSMHCWNILKLCWI